LHEIVATVGIGLDLPLGADAPAEHDAVGWLEGEHAGQAALAAIDAAVVDVAAHVGLEDGPGDVDREHVVLGRLEAAEAIGEDREGPLDRRFDDDRAPDGGVRCLRTHEISFICCSTAVL
jgi:hypothetical protein